MPTSLIFLTFPDHALTYPNRIVLSWHRNNMQKSNKHPTTLMIEKLNFLTFPVAVILSWFFKEKYFVHSTPILLNFIFENGGSEYDGLLRRAARIQYLTLIMGLLLGIYTETVFRILWHLVKKQ